MENYFFLLELPFNPPESDEEKIKRVINQKENQWKRDSTSRNPGKRAEAIKYLARLDDIRAVMLNFASRNAAADEVKKTKAEKQAELEQKLTLYRTIGDVLSEQSLKQMSAQFGPFGFTEGEIKRFFEKGQAQKVREINPAEVLDRNRAEMVKNCLNQLHISGKTLYDFLGPSFTSSSSVSQLCEAAAVMKKKILDKGRKTDEDSARQELCGLCAVIFKDQSGKRKYDNYVKLTEHAKVNDAVDDLALANQMVITPRMKEALINVAIQCSPLGVPDASVYINNYCAYMGYLQADDKVICSHCSTENPASSTSCAVCGKPLFIFCPSCGQRCSSGAEICSCCGFKMENMDRAETLCDLAERAIGNLDFRAAEARLAEADRLWPGNKRVPNLRGRLAADRQRAGTMPSKLREMVEARLYKEAKRQYDAIQGLFPGYSDPALEQKVNMAINNAQSLCDRARRSGQEDEVLNLCSQAAALCVDLPDIRELRAKYPPAPPTKFSVKADPHARGNALSWNVRPGGKPAGCVVVRSDSRRVRGPVDGKEIFRGIASSYWDMDIEPGITYWYNVFTERDGVLSSGAAEGGREVVNLFETGPVSITPGDGSLRLSWGTLPRNATVELYLSSPSGEKHLVSTRAESYLLTGIANGVERRFRVALSYTSGGRKLETAGVTASGAPACPPDQVDALRVRFAQEGVYEAVWQHTEHGEVRLYVSARMPGWRAGDVLPLSTLEREMTVLQTQSLSPASAGKLRQEERGVSFRDSGWETMYVTAVSVKSGSAVFGPLVRVGRGALAAIRDIRLVNGKIHIFLDVPRDVSGFVVLYRFDRFPLGLSDPEAVALSFTKRQYELNDAILLDAPEERTYYFTVFAWFHQNGEKEWSPGVERVFDYSPKTVITYSISLARSLFGSRSLILEFQAGGKRFTLPDIDVLSAVGATPMFRTSAILLHTIPSQEAEGSLQVKIPLPKGTPKDTYIRPVFRDEAAQNRYQLHLKVRSNHKIT